MHKEVEGGGQAGQGRGMAGGQEGEEAGPVAAEEGECQAVHLLRVLAQVAQRCHPECHAPAPSTCCFDTF